MSLSDDEVSGGKQDSLLPKHVSMVSALITCFLCTYCFYNFILLC